MLLLLLALTFLQIFLVPGLICVGRLRSLDYLDRFLLAIPASIFMNYLMVLILVVFGMYTNVAVISIFILEVIILILFGYGFINQGHSGVNQKEITSLFIKDRLLWMKKIITIKGGSVLITLVLLTQLGVFSAWYGESSEWNGFFSWWYHQLGTVIDDWDGVVSWHRWAMHWYNGELPVGYWTYPQVIPALYSLSYKFINTSEIYFAPKFIPVLIPVIIIITAIRLAFILRKTSFVEILIAIPIFYYLVSRTVYLNYAFSGGADMAMAYYGIICVYCVALSRQAYSEGKVKEYYELMFWLAVITSSAFVVKQMGVFVLGFFIVSWLWYSRSFPLVRVNRYKVFLGISVVAILIPAHWYLYVIYNSQNISSDVGIYEAVLKTGWYTRPYEGFKMLYAQFGWWPLAFIIIGLFIKLNRVLVFPVMLVYFFWAYTVSYDSRNLYVILPLFSYLIASGIIGIIYFTLNAVFIKVGWHVPINVKNLFLIAVSDCKKYCIHYLFLLPLINKLSSIVYLNPSKLGRRVFCEDISSKARILMVVMFFLTPILIFKNDVSSLNYAWAKEKSLNEQLKIGGVWQMNHYLYDKFRPKYSGTGVRIATDYQMMFYIPGLEEFYSDVHTLDYNYFSKAFIDKNIGFILLANTAKKEIIDYMSDGVETGRFELLLLAHDYRFYKILKPENNCLEYMNLNPTATRGKCQH